MTKHCHNDGHNHDDHHHADDADEEVEDLNERIKRIINSTNNTSSTIRSRSRPLTTTSTATTALTAAAAGKRSTDRDQNTGSKRHLSHIDSKAKSSFSGGTGNNDSSTVRKFGISSTYDCNSRWATRRKNARESTSKNYNLHNSFKSCTNNINSCRGLYGKRCKDGYNIDENDDSDDRGGYCGSGDDNDNGDYDVDAGGGDFVDDERKFKSKYNKYNTNDTEEAYQGKYNTMNVRYLKNGVLRNYDLKRSSMETDPVLKRAQKVLGTQHREKNAFDRSTGTGIILRKACMRDDSSLDNNYNYCQHRSDSLLKCNRMISPDKGDGRRIDNISSLNLDNIHFMSTGLSSPSSSSSLSPRKACLSH